MFPLSHLRKRHEVLPGSEAPAGPVGRWRSRWLERLVFAAITGGLAFALYRLINPPQAWVILVDGQPVAAVAGRQAAEAIIASVKRRSAGDLASVAQFDQKVEIEPASASEQPVISRWQAQERIGKAVSLSIPAHRLLVNGNRAVTLSSVDEVRRTLEALLSHYVPKGARLLAPPRIKEELTVEEAVLSPEEARRELLKPQQALQALLSPAVKPRVYEVAAGDTGTRIARRHGITLEDLRRANPEMDLDHLQIGDRLVVAGGKPVVSVVTYVEEVREVPIASWTQTITTASLKPGQRQVIQQGQPGSQEVRVKVTYLNGEEVRRSTVYGKVISEPIPSRFLVGGRPPRRSSRIGPTVARGASRPRAASTPSFIPAANACSEIGSGGNSRQVGG